MKALDLLVPVDAGNVVSESAKGNQSSSSSLIVVFNPDDVDFPEIASGLDSIKSSMILPGFSIQCTAPIGM
ncbi:hypothetical protein ACVWZ6_003359 [Bradyrhizobium sp. GM6.1]|jgi:hypothetical protein